MSGHVATDLLNAGPPAAGVCRDPCRSTARLLKDAVGGDRETVRGRIRRAGKAVRSWHGTAGSPLDAKARETPGVARYNFLSFRGDEARNLLDELLARSRNQFVHPSQLAVINGALDDRDNTFIELEEAIRVRERGVATLHLNPLFEPLRADPRFAAVLQKIRSSSRV